MNLEYYDPKSEMLNALPFGALHSHWEQAISLSEKNLLRIFIVCVEALRPSQPIRVMSSRVNLLNHTYS